MKAIYLVEEWTDNFNCHIINWFNNEHSASACVNKLNIKYGKHGFYYVFRCIEQEEVEMPHYTPKLN